MIVLHRPQNRTLVLLCQESEKVQEKLVAADHRGQYRTPRRTHPCNMNAFFHWNHGLWVCKVSFRFGDIKLSHDMTLVNFL